MIRKEIVFSFVKEVTKDVTDKLCSEIWTQLALQWNFQSDLQDIRSILCSLQAVLEDAERRSMNDESVRLWLKKLKVVAYDIEDMLNDFDVQKNQENCNDVRNVVGRLFSRSNPVTMANKMKDIRERLQKITEDNRKFALKVEFVSDRQEVIKKRETFSNVEATQVLGREREKQEIIEKMLATNNNTEVSVVSIVGLGGLGKTTLAKLIFNDNRTSVFNLKVWVHAMEFDVKTLARTIISSETERRHLDDLEAISKCIKTLLNGKRYLIVLDDVWNQVEEKWNSLKLMLQGGECGSIILVTTRNQDVAWMMGSGIIHDLKYLSDDDCRTLFEQRAFQPGGVERRPILLQIGQEIVKKCGGVPLAAKVLGGMLRTERGEEAWKDARDKIWGIEQHEDGQQFENQILASLKVSYQYMPSPIKLCFLYCSIFPKSSHLDKDKLIQQWIAQGFIRSQRQSKLLDIGESYFNYLVSISFLQRGDHESSGRVMYKMHNLVYNLARAIAGNEVLTVVAGEETKSNLQECLYALLIEYHEPSQLQNALPEKARALHFQGCLIFSLPRDAFSRARCVRVLDFNGCSFDGLPTSLSELKQLRYLDASRRQIQSLDAIVELKNLEMLNLQYCQINELPSTIGKLRKLFLLNLSGCSNISTLPSSIEDLSRLLYLNLSGCCQIRRLPESISRLKELCSLNLGDCCRLETLSQSIGNLERLKFLDLSNCSTLRELPESFRKLHSLQKLIIRGCELPLEVPRNINNFLEIIY